jgi:RNA polymerase sigma factor (sigma-70 family)
MRDTTGSAAIDDRTFDLSVRAHRDSLRAYCARYADWRDEVDDWSQATLAIAWSERANFRGDGPFQAWLFGIARSVCLRGVRSRPPHAVLKALDEIPASTTNALDSLIQREHVECVIRCMLRLPERQMMVVLWRYFGGYTIAEVSAGMRCAPGTVKATCHQGIKALQKLLMDQSNLPRSERLRIARRASG